MVLPAATSMASPPSKQDVVFLFCGGKDCKKPTPHVFERLEAAPRAKAMIYSCLQCETERLWGLLSNYEN